GYDRRAVRAETEEIVFDEHRPVRQEHPFGAVSGPAGLVSADLAYDQACRVVEREARLRPRRATLAVEQDVRLHEIADAARQGIEPAHMAVEASGEHAVRERRRLANARSIAHVADADDPCAHLIVATDLATAGESAVAARRGEAGRNVGHFDIRPGAADVAAGIATRPRKGVTAVRPASRVAIRGPATSGIAPGSHSLARHTRKPPHA